jgi:hypothetical protein
VKTKHKFLRAKVLALSMAAVSFFCTPIAASAAVATKINTRNECSLTLDYPDEEGFISDEEFRLYQIANIDEDNELTFTSEFAESGVSLDNDSAGDWSDCAATLETYILEQQWLGNEIEPVAEKSTDGSGTLTFENLDTAVYLLAGDSITVGDNIYIPSTSLIALPNTDETDGQLNYNPVIVPKYEILDLPNNEYPVKTKISVEKVWDDSGYEQQRPEEISVVLFKDGEEYDKVTLSEENNWKYTWEVFDEECRWQLIEENVPDGYTMTSVPENGSFIVTNTIDESDPPEDPSEPSEEPSNPSEEPSDPESPSEPTESTEPSEPVKSSTSVTSGDTSTIITKTTSTTVTQSTLPQTGQLEWPIPILAAGGMIMLTEGCILRRKHRDDNEK